MSKRIFLTLLVIVAVIGTCVYATDIDLTPSTSAEELQNTPLLGTDNNANLVPTQTAEDLQNTALVSDDYEGSEIPEEWRRDVTPDMWRDEALDGAIDHDLFMAEQVVSIDNKIIDGNAFISGEDVTVSKMDIYGDAYIIGKKIDIKNMYVVGNIYLAAEDVSFSEVSCTGNAYMAGKTVKILKGTCQDLFMAASDVTIDENTLVTRNVYAGVKSIVVGPTVEISRNANITGAEINVADEAIVGGDLNKNVVEKEDIEEEDTFSFADAIKSVLGTIVTAVVVNGFIFLYARGFVEKQKSDNVVKHLGVNLAKGLGLVILIPVVAIILMITGVGAGVGLLAIFAYIMFIAIGTPLVSVAITTSVVKEDNAGKLYGMSVLVAAVIAVLKQIPAVGGIVIILVGLTGMGLIFTRKKNEVKEEVVTPTESV